MKELFINVEPMETRVAVLQDGVFEEFYVERSSPVPLLGNIYKGKVTSIVPGIRAAFVDLGIGKNGFLYLTDIVGPSPEVEESVPLEGSPSPAPHLSGSQMPRIQDLVRIGQEILVQVIKEPMGTKGPRLSTHLTLPGRFIVLMPLDDTFGISKRIDDPKERERLRTLMKELHAPRDMGIIVRTAADGADRKQLSRDLRFLLSLWKRVKVRSVRATAPALIHEEYDLPLRIVRDNLSEDVKKIILDSRAEYQQLQRFLIQTEPHMRSRVELYRDEIPLFEKRGLEKEIEKIYNRKVELPSGGYLVIEPTEGLVAIDVNSGKFTGRKNLEETAFVTNMEAAKEIARQIRLRDLGGILIFDFIDMNSQSHKQRVFNTLQNALRKDRAKTNVSFLSEFGLVEMTRQRVRRSLESVSFQECPTCLGRGKIRSVLTVSILALRQIKRVFQSSRKQAVEVVVHPDLASRLFNEDRDSIAAIESQYKGRVIVKPDPSVPLEMVKVQPLEDAKTAGR
ncbi:MAG: Rne/Rng family ribonuclease [Candidatus Omnitrophica bacterium]|nr:Rne/Rng family ribonuclease [Candidatus Omnitrophota bacterium]